jgi:isopentenyl-diphosphate Delta-isomerase
MGTTTWGADLDDLVVLVDGVDREVGVASKRDAHGAPGLLHRAVSACLFDRRGRVLLQRRALSKYHFAGQWSNACCTHPRPGESAHDAIERRVREELGVRARRLHLAGSFVYRAADPSSALVEHELDHVFVGRVDEVPAPDPREVMATELVRLGGPDPFAGRTLTPWCRDVLRIARAASAA